MSFVESQFPSDISFGAQGGATFSTDIVATFGGHEKRNINWSEARGRWNVAHGVRTEAQYATLIAFFRARKGRAVGFRFKDWSDFEVTGGNIGTGTGSQTVFQLRKQYIDGGVTVNRTITKPVAGTVTAYVNGSPTSVTVDTTTGEITFSSAPASGAVITADFEFDVPVRFDTDQMNLSLDSFQTGGWNDIPVVELRVET